VKRRLPNILVDPAKCEAEHIDAIRAASTDTITLGGIEYMRVPRRDWLKIAKPCKRERSRGLGDTVEKVLDRATGGRAQAWAQKAAQAVGAKDCGCGKRKAALNRLVPYGGDKS
jgi:hypothetical protein